MRLRKLSVAMVLGLSGLSLAVGHEPQAIFTRASSVSDLPYKSHGSEYELARCKLDLYLPQDQDSFPVLVWFHGGGLTAGNKAAKTQQRVGITLAREGIAVASAGYRLSPKVQFPAYVEDAAAAVAWVERNIADYGGNPQSLFVGGFSAGATLAALLAVDDRFLVEQTSHPNHVKGFVLVSGQLDSHSTIRAERGVNAETPLIDSTAPLFHVSRKIPPLLTMIGGKEKRQRVGVNRQFVEKLRKLDHPDVALAVIPGRTHTSLLSTFGQTDDLATSKTVAFVRAHLSKQLLEQEVGQIEPLHRCGNIYLAGQPQPEDLEILQRLGVNTVVTVREDDEIDWDESEKVDALGMRFVSVPFQASDELTDEVFDQLLGVLQDRQTGPTFFHCGVANRVGAVWYAHRILNDKLSPEAALKESVKVGLRSPGLLKRAKAYVRQKRASH